MKKLHSYSDRGKCDEKFTALQLEVAMKLDDWHGLSRDTRGATPSEHYEERELGPITIRVPKKEMVPSSTGWQKETSSWEDIREIYQKISHDLHDERWSGLNRMVHSILSDDEDRFQGWGNYELNKDSGPDVIRAHSEVASCADDRRCFEPVFSRQTRHFFDRHLRYRSLFAKVNQAAPSDKRGKIEDLRRRLMSDRYRYVFTPDTSVHREDRQTFKVTLNPGSFKGFEREVSQFIESVWKSATRRVLVDWKETPEPYRLVAGSDVGGRSFVEHNDRTVNLFPQIRAVSIAHEIGHVLGFRDKYYTSWEPENCQYVIEYREDDLMSASVAGTVTDGSWAELEQAYPLQ